MVVNLGSIYTVNKKLFLPSSVGEKHFTLRSFLRIRVVTGLGVAGVSLNFISMLCVVLW